MQRYGITLAIYWTIYARQRGCCAICQIEYPRDKRNRRLPLNVDHDHETGEVRGLLCGTCNSGLGMFQDKLERFDSAKRYLRAARRGG